MGSESIFGLTLSPRSLPDCERIPKEEGARTFPAIQRVANEVMMLPLVLSDSDQTQTDELQRQLTGRQSVLGVGGRSLVPVSRQCS